MAPPLSLQVISSSYDPEVVLRELVAALHLDLVSGELGLPRERQISFVILSRIATAVVRASRRQRPLRAIPLSQVVAHRMSPSEERVARPSRVGIAAWKAAAWPHG
jgi:hypothetical protein